MGIKVCIGIKYCLQTLLLIYIFPVPDQYHKNNKDIIYNIVNDAVIANASTEARPAPEFSIPMRPWVIC